MVTKLQLVLNHLRDHKFKHSFQDCLNPVCSSSNEVEASGHFLLHCLNYLHERETILDNVKSVLPNILEQIDFFINNVLLFGDTSLDNSSNTIILKVAIKCMTSTKRFNDSTFTF